MSRFLEAAAVVAVSLIALALIVAATNGPRPNPFDVSKPCPVVGRNCRCPGCDTCPICHPFRGDTGSIVGQAADE